MNKIKTSELVVKMAVASEEACKCEDDNFERVSKLNKPGNVPITVNEVMVIARAVSDFTRFSTIRTVCKVLQEYDLIEKDIDVFNNVEFLNTLEEYIKIINNNQ